MQINAESTISEIVRFDYRTADVFKNHNINYCCGGTTDLETVCHKQGLDYNNILVELEVAMRKISLPSNLPFKEWKIDFLIDYIINVHHAYLYQALPAIESRLIAFMNSHIKKLPELHSISDVFEQLSKLLIAHNRNEEEVIFPYIKQLDSAFRGNESYGSLFVRTLRKPLISIENEHKEIGKFLKRMVLYTNNYSFPVNACLNHRVLFYKMQELHLDLIQHKHLESKILFPKAAEIEKQLLLN
ncbi:MAG TPA: DUF542 domain-containing protein [Ferruginibacter sp.]|nr:DUF542 domain-containing protein [Ferruginibacter sp.]